MKTNLSPSLESLVDSINSESDRGAVLVCTDYLDQFLTKLLETKMRGSPKTKQDLLRPGGPLGSFCTKIRIAYAFNLISDSIYTDLGIIRDIRNKVAHSYESRDFGFDSVQQKTRQLRTGDEMCGIPPGQRGAAKAKDQQVSKQEQKLEDKKYFILSVICIAGVLKGRLSE